MRLLFAVFLFLATFPHGGAPMAAESSPAGIVFSRAEQDYLQRVRSVTMCVDPDWVPFERIDGQGRHEGIAADLIRLVAQRVGLAVELLPVKTWEESLAASKAGRCQIMSFLNQTPARDAWLLFTEPVFFDQNIIITREEHPYIGDPKGLSNETVALPKGTMVGERLRRDYPGLRIVNTESEAQAVELVSRREADMTIRSLIVAAYAIKKEGLFNLKISGQIPELTNKLRIGVIRSEPLLRDILDKGVRTITPQEREAIANAHVAINVQRGVDYSLVWKIAAGLGALVLLVLYWNRKLRALNRELERLSVTDRLTNLFNRMKLDAEMSAEIQRAARFGRTFSVILLDIDHFKQVNDTHGHHAGDALLVEIAGILQRNTRETDVVERWGGEEFMIICPHTEQDGAATLAEKLRGLIEQQASGPGGPTTASFGVTTGRPGDQGQDLVMRADGALYDAKHAGRNRVAVR